MCDKFLPLNYRKTPSTIIPEKTEKIYYRHQKFITIFQEITLKLFVTDINTKTKKNLYIRLKILYYQRKKTLFLYIF